MLNELIHSLSAHPHFAYGAVFLAALLEALPAVGLFVPGSTIIVGLSALVATGDINLTGVLAAAMLGATLGDSGVFWLGRNRPALICGLWPLSRYPEAISRCQRFFAHHGSAAVFLAHFVPAIRCFIPLVAGVMGMPPSRFFLFGLSAIVLWALAHVIPGMLAGTIYARSGMVAENMLTFGSGLAAIAVLIWAIRRWVWSS